MVEYPAPPQYAPATTPSSLFRASLKGSAPSEALGQPERAAAAFIKLAETPIADLPLRVQFGSDSYALIRGKAQKTISDGEKWAELSHTTNHEGVDAEKVLETLAKVVVY